MKRALFALVAAMTVVVPCRLVAQNDFASSGWQRTRTVKTRR